MRRVKRAAPILAAIILLLDVGVLSLRKSTRISVDTAVERYRRNATATPAGPAESGPPAVAASKAEVARAVTETPRPAASTAVTKEGFTLPAPGVYVYETAGAEDVDVLGGTRHEYPQTTTITVRHAGCGLIQRWDALAERWDERESCPSPTEEALRRFTSYHEFFQHQDLRTFVCDPGTLAWSGSTEPGAAWRGRCVSGETVAVLLGTVVGREALNVEGKPVDTLHVRVDTQITGDQRGTSRHEVWGALGSRLVVREISRTDSDSEQPLLGTVHYHEAYELRLTSLEPRR